MVCSNKQHLDQQSSALDEKSWNDIYLLFSPSVTVLLHQGEGSHGGFVRFLPKNPQHFHAVHALTFLFRGLTIVLFHPTHAAIIYVKSPLKTPKKEKAPTVDPLLLHVSPLWT